MREKANYNATMSYSFSGHETFPFRYGWLKKGVDVIADDAAFFLNERAMVKLGTGKNMVQSIKHWCLATNVIQERTDDQAHRGQYEVTNLGREFFFDDGYDPYLEDTATLWLLHWQLASNMTQATTWFWMFNLWNSVEFNKETIKREVQLWLEKQGHKAVSENTLKRDIDCFVRIYVASKQSFAKTAVLEDTLDCPLADLRLITEIEDGKTYQFQRGAQTSLPDEIFAYALTEFWNTNNETSQTKTIALNKIVYDEGSPGRIFKLDDDSVASRLEKIESLSDGAFSYDETAGLKQVYKRVEIEPMILLRKHYQKQLAKAASTK
jgi:hypothetical protein